VTAAISRGGAPGFLRRFFGLGFSPAPHGMEAGRGVVLSLGFRRRKKGGVHVLKKLRSGAKRNGAILSSFLLAANREQMPIPAAKGGFLAYFVYALCDILFNWLKTALKRLSGR
jgi:hypothetical protein